MNLLRILGLLLLEDHPREERPQESDDGDIRQRYQDLIILLLLSPLVGGIGRKIIRSR